MAEPGRTNYGLRVAFILPALAVIIVIAIVAGSDPNFTPPAVLIPGVALVAILSMVLTEQLMKRKRRQRRPQ